MKPHFLLLAGEVDGGLAALGARAGVATGLRKKLLQPHLAVLANDGCRCLPIEDAGAVVGTLFRQDGGILPVEHLDDADAARIVQSRGSDLLARYWGGYVAAVGKQDSLRLLRDPSAALPCYFACRSGLTAFASDPELLVAAGLTSVQIDWPALARHLFNAGVPAPETALSGISELLPGYVIEGPIFDRQVPCWSPWDHVQPKLETALEASERLGQVVRQCVQSWCSSRGRLLVSVSGGLDSSIVAACVTEAGLEATCLTIYGEDAAGDERPYARALCDHLKVSLHERPDLLEAIDITEPLDPHLPRPIGRTQALSYEKAHLAVAKELGADAFVTGNGGDSVFGYSQSAAAIADRYLVEGLGAPVVSSLIDVVRQTGCSAWQAATAALRLVRGPRSYVLRPGRLFLNSDLLETLNQTPPRHPWLEAPANGLPGKAAHIASILRVQHCLEPGRSAVLPVLNPLMSQPIIETCLAIPSWHWREGGRDRAVARCAFAASLPAMVARRRVKGGPDGFAVRILDAYRPAIRQRLLDGHLARQNILDKRAVEQVLAEGRSVPGEEQVRLFALLAAEAWLDPWLAKASPRGAGGGAPEACSDHLPDVSGWRSASQ